MRKLLANDNFDFSGSDLKIEIPPPPVNTTWTVPYYLGSLIKALRYLIMSFYSRQTLITENKFWWLFIVFWYLCRNPQFFLLWRLRSHSKCVVQVQYFLNSTGKIQAEFSLTSITIILFSILVMLFDTYSGVSLRGTNHKADTSINRTPIQGTNISLITFSQLVSIKRTIIKRTIIKWTSYKRNTPFGKKWMFPLKNPSKADTNEKH